MVKSTLHALVAVGTVLAGVFASSARAQGTGAYLNFETPVHDPMKVASIGGSEYLLVCNAQDNSVEVYTATSDPTFVLRVPTGQEPTAVVVRPTPTGAGGVRAYTANWLGDSVTSFELTPNAGPGAALSARVVRTTFVGDEPIGLVILPEISGLAYSQPGGLGHESLFVTFAAQSEWGWFNPETLSPIIAGWGALELAVENDDPATSDLVEHIGVQEPRTIAFSPATASGNNTPNLLCILNVHGGNDPTQYDMDLFVTDNLIQSAFDLRNPGGLTPGPFYSLPYVFGTGTTNLGMAFAPNGDLYIVSQNARNKESGLTEFVEGVGEPEHLRLVVEETGFVTSQLVRVRAVGTLQDAVEVHDLNLENGGQTGTPITQPTHVLVYGSGVEGETRVFVTGFNSDTLGMIEPSEAADPQDWSVARINVEAGVPFDHDSLGGRMRGPRAFAIKASGVPNDPGDILYCYNRLEHSVTVLDPNFDTASPQNAIVRTFRLQNDPTPRHIKAGRKFLYSSRLSASGTASCASCHIDSRIDHLGWNLSDNVAVPPEGDPEALLDALGPNAAIKGPMQTQFLVGLTTFEIADDSTQDEFFSSRPYHWRGDRGFFEHFNGAFISLMGMPTPHSATEGIPPEMMKAYRDMVFSVHYPPNPDQPFDRRYGGSFFDENDPPANEAEEDLQLNDPTVGSGAAKGLKLFHQVVSDSVLGADTSCVSCHALPDGSNNRLTDLELPFVGFENSEAQDIETAQMRGLHLKHKLNLGRNAAGDFKYFPNAGGLAPAKTAEFGMTHTGLNSLATTPFDISNTLLDFNLAVFIGVGIFNVVDLSHYSLEFDTGVAPSVGFTGTLDPATYGMNEAGFLDAVATQELQVTEVNAELAVHARVGGTLHGFFYDVTDAVTPYHEVQHGGVPPLSNLSTAGLLDLLDTGSGADPDNLLVFHFTPLGSSRRVAFLDGGNPPVPGLLSPPSNLQLLGCRPIVANLEIPRMTTFWEESVDNIFANPSGIDDPVNVVDTNLTIAWYQKSLLSWAGAATPPGFGLPQLRHEPPRRFRVQGDGIQHGSVLRIYAPTAADILTASETTPPTTTPVEGQTTVLQLPLYPGRDAGGPVVWETAAELESIYLYGFLNGGPNNTWVATALEDPRDPALVDIEINDLMQPLLWNWWYVEVRNAPGQPASTGSGGWQRLTLD